MNKVVFCGRLTRDPEIRYTGGNEPMAIATFSLAVDRRFKRQDEPDADFFNCTAFKKQAEFVEKYLKQGTKILISGRVQNNNYTNKDGQKVYSTQIMVEEIEFAESKRNDEQPQPKPTTDQDGFMNIPTCGEEDLPF